MKLISLNTWGGRIWEPLKEFVQQQAEEADIFCFQEVNNTGLSSQTKVPGERSDLFNELQTLLPDFIGYHAEQAPGIGMATFVRSSITTGQVNSFVILAAEEEGHMKLSHGERPYARIVQRIAVQQPALTIYNFHGVPGTQKKDSPERDLQTVRLQGVLNQDSGAKVLVGDFNLDIGTKAIAALEANLRNLIRESGVKTTRNHYYKPMGTIPFADYAFVSPGLRVKHFEVLQDEVSDHLPLLLELE